MNIGRVGTRRPYNVQDVVWTAQSSAKHSVGKISNLCQLCKVPYRFFSRKTEPLI